MEEGLSLLPPRSTRSNSHSNPQVSSRREDQDNFWGGTPELRKVWVKQKSIILNDSSDEIPHKLETQYKSIDEEADMIVDDADETSSVSTVAMNSRKPYSFESWGFMNAVKGTPGLIIALTLNLFLSMSFGQAFFPNEWIFPDEVPRAIGVQMFLFSTCICQVVMTLFSDFSSAMGMMMVENIPFMHVIAKAIIDKNGMGLDSFSTVLVAFALSTIVVGICFYLLGRFGLGNAVYFFPRHVIIGCIGGIGIFIFQTGVEVSTDQTWKWTLDSILTFATTDSAMRWGLSLIFVIILRIILAVFNAPLLAPFYFVAIPPIFYLILFCIDVSPEQAHEDGWFFDRTEHTDPALMWKLIDFGTVDWAVIGSCFPTIIALTIFSLMHVPINIPSLSMSTHEDVDINQELMAHGYSNLLVGLGGGLQNYLCYSNSLLYFKCQGGGMVSGVLMSIITAVFFYFGPSVVYYMPRTMPGSLLIHIGIDLSSEALWDSIGAFDIIEYGSIVAITIVMTFYGMTAGLGLGVICAALTFTLQTSRHVQPIRGTMCARTLRSSAWRTAEESRQLDKVTRNIRVIQLQGHLFFGNATLMAAEVEKMLLAQKKEKDYSKKSLYFLVLDFTLVVAIDSSAANTIIKISNICDRYRVRLCYCTGNPLGFPCTAPLSESLQQLEGGPTMAQLAHCPHCGSFDLHSHPPTKRLTCSACGVDCEQIWYNRVLKQKVHLTHSLDESLAWCEDVLLTHEQNKVALPFSEEINHATNITSPRHTNLAMLKGVPNYLQEIFVLASKEPREKIEKMMTYFTPQTVRAGTVLWVQGDEADRCVLLRQGLLHHLLEEEAGTTEDIAPGHLVGEYGLLNGQTRLGTLSVKEDAEMLVLDKKSFQRMKKDDPQLAFILSKICIGYLGRRVMYVANRIWESHCLPV